MDKKPTVVFALPQSIYVQMFRKMDLDALGRIALIKGPPPTMNSSAIQETLSDAVVAITGWDSPRFDEELLRHAPKLGLIVHSAGTVKPLISDAVYDRGIRVVTSAGENSIPVAQYTVAMMASLLKQIPWISERYRLDDRKGLAARSAQMRELMDLNIGLVGASRVGREVIRLLKSYPRLTIKLYDPYVSPAEAQRLGAQLASLEDVCQCDVVSLHAPGNADTRHMFNARTLALLPDHAVLLNTARGALIDESALIAEVRRRPLYVCLDVTDAQPLPMESPLRSEENIILTPHVAGAMRQGRAQMGRFAIEQAIRFISNQPIDGEVTREMLKTQA